MELQGFISLGLIFALLSLLCGAYGRVGRDILETDRWTALARQRTFTTPDFEQAILFVTMVAIGLFLASRMADLEKVVTAAVVGCGLTLAVLSRHRSASLSIAAAAVASGVILNVTLLESGPLPTALALIVGAIFLTPVFWKRHRVEAILDSMVAIIATCSLGVEPSMAALAAGCFAAIIISQVRRLPTLRLFPSLAVVTMLAIAVNVALV